MSNQNIHSPEQELTTEEKAAQAVTHTVEAIDKNKNIILYVLIGILVIVGAVLAYINFYRNPRIKAADEAIASAQRYFERDSFQLALNGNGADVVGFKGIIDEYSGTPAANLSHYYAGVSLFHLGKYEEAISELKKYKGDDMMVAPAAKGLTGDAFVELGKTEEAITYFENAAKMADNQVISPIYLQKAAVAYQSLGQKDKALEIYHSIKDNYSGTPLATEAEKQITALSL